MRHTVVIRTLGVLFLLFSTTLLPPIALSIAYHDGELGHFSITFAIAVVIGVMLWLPLQTKEAEPIRTRDAFVIVGMMWTAMSLLGAVPFMMALDMSFADAVFESASGYTTTGSTVLVGLDAMPPSILMYRQELQWIGGLGVIVLAIALLPMLGVGGMQLYKRETPGPYKEDRITPRIARTARSLYLVYLAVTAACALGYWLAGMSAFDAIAHSMSTVSTGGYSTHDASISYYHSPAIEAVSIVFMLAGGMNFSVHFLAWRGLRLTAYVKDSQVRAFLAIVAAMIVITTGILLYNGVGASLLESLRYAAFEVASVITSTGFGIADFSAWPLALPALLIFSSFIGGCAGSTAGGMKVVRFLVLGKQAGVHLQRLIHPQAVRPVRMDGRVVPDSVIEGIWGFFVMYIGVFSVLMLLLMMDGMDQVSAFGAVATCMNNLGPGLGSVASNFVTVSATGKLLLSLAMVLGRLEIFTLLVIFTPAFWRY
jgi:trk system potassium uptake protein TrkH